MVGSVAKTSKQLQELFVLQAANVAAYSRISPPTVTLSLHRPYH